MCPSLADGVSTFETALTSVDLSDEGASLVEEVVASLVEVSTGVGFGWPLLDR